MIDIAHAKQEFEKYLDEYDRQDEQIYLKIEQGRSPDGWSVPGKTWNLQN